MSTRPLTSPPPAPLLTNAGDAMPALSPDGRLLAFVRETHEGWTFSSPNSRRRTGVAAPRRAG